MNQDTKSCKDVKQCQFALILLESLISSKSSSGYRTSEPYYVQMPLSMTWKRMAPSPEVSRTAAGRWNKIFGDRLISSDVIWRSGSCKIVEADEMMRSMAVSHMGSLKTPTKKNKQAMPPLRGNPQKKIYHTNLRQVWILPPKKMAIFHDPELHIPPFLKNIYIYPSQPGGDWKLSWTKHAQSKSYNLSCAASLGWYLGTGPFGGIIKERRFTSTCHTLKPTQQEGFRSQNDLQDSTKARIICVFSHCTSSEQDYGVK